MLSLKNNIQALTSRRALQQVSFDNDKANQQLSSGLKINMAADDAAGLAMSEKMRAEIRSLHAAQSNAENGVSLVQTAEGGLNEINNILSRLRELSIQSASDTIGGNEREFLQKEYGQLKDEINRIASSSDFNGTPLLAGSGDFLPTERQAASNQYPLEIHVGAHFFSEIDGADIPKPQNIIRVNLENFNAMTYGENSLDLGETADPEGTRIDNKRDAQDGIYKIDVAIQKVSEFRAYLGAIQNRFESTTRNLGVQIENMTASESRIRDADIAEASGKAAQSSILKQAGAAVLAQANFSPQIALKLLG